VADADRRTLCYPPDPAALGLALVAVVVVLRLEARTPAQLARTAVRVLPCAALGLVLVSAPDVLEQLLVTGVARVGQRRQKRWCTARPVGLATCSWW